MCVSFSLLTPLFFSLSLSNVSLFLPSRLSFYLFVHPSVRLPLCHSLVTPLQRDNETACRGKLKAVSAEGAVPRQPVPSSLACLLVRKRLHAVERVFT